MNQAKTLIPTFPSTFLMPPGIWTPEAPLYPIKDPKKKSNPKFLQLKNGIQNVRLFLQPELLQNTEKVLVKTVEP